MSKFDRFFYDKHWGKQVGQHALQPSVRYRYQLVLSEVKKKGLPTT